MGDTNIAHVSVDLWLSPTRTLVPHWTPLVHQQDQGSLSGTSSFQPYLPDWSQRSPDAHVTVPPRINCCCDVTGESLSWKCRSAICRRTGMSTFGSPENSNIEHCEGFFCPKLCVERIEGFYRRLLSTCLLRVVNRR